MGNCRLVKGGGGVGEGEGKRLRVEDFGCVTMK